MGIKRGIRNALRKVGYDVRRFPPVPDAVLRRKRLLETYAIDVVIDVGANAGQFARQLRRDIEYSNRIVSLEPMRSAFNLLQENARGDPGWQTFNFGLGDTDGTSVINVAGNSLSSSLLDMLPSHIEAAPESEYVGREEIAIRRLDTLFDEICGRGERIYLKIDTQGFESKVLSGAAKSLPYIDTIQLEMSLVPLYGGELLFPEMHQVLAEKGYSLVSIEAGFADERSGQLLQIDGIFHRFRPGPA